MSAAVAGLVLAQAHVGWSVVQRDADRRLGTMVSQVGVLARCRIWGEEFDDTGDDIRVA